MTETEQLAATAWLALKRDVRPMPAGFALDMVQDACGDRGEALHAILVAFVQRMERLRPEQPGDKPTPSANLMAAAAACAHILGGHLDLAEKCRKEIRERASAMYVDRRTPAEHKLGADWLRWADYLKNDLARCEKLEEAATAAK